MQTTETLILYCPHHAQCGGELVCTGTFPVRVNGQTVIRETYQCSHCDYAEDLDNTDELVFHAIPML